VTPKKKLNESVVSDIQVQEFFDNVKLSGDSVTFNGTIGLVAKVLNKSGKPIEVYYSVDVIARSDLEWDTDEIDVAGPAGPESDTFREVDYATSGEIEVESVNFTPNGDFMYGDDDVDFDTFKNNLYPQSLQQLLNPEIYKNVLGSQFDSAAKSAQPSDDHYDYRD
jgi:hypothetical protein